MGQVRMASLRGSILKVLPGIMEYLNITAETKELLSSTSVRQDDWLTRWFQSSETMTEADGMTEITSQWLTPW